MAVRPRKTALKAILIADMVDYSRRVSEREASTLDFVARCFTLFREHCTRFDASVIKTMGDGIMIEFASASEAIQYGLEMHGAIERLQDDSARKAQFRIGVHAGEVESVDSDIYGHAVNVASRVVGFAKPGGICVSHDVYQQARHHPSFVFASAGPTRLKNIPEPMMLYHVTSGGKAPQTEAARFLIRTIGSISITDEAGHKADLRSEHVRALLGYLALSPGHGDYKERLAALLWSEREAQAARRALAQCLRSTADAFRSLPSSPLLQEDGQLALDERNVAVDLDDISDKIELGVIDKLLVERPDWPDALLRGTDALGHLYRSWLQVTRHNWRTKIADALEVCLGRFEPGDTALRRAATALLALEPGHEIAVQKLISHYAHHHNVAMAVKTFKAFSTYVGAQFQISPSQATATLIRNITEGNWEKANDTVPAPKAKNLAPTLEVGRIDISALAQKDIHVAAGFRNELVANLARFREWIVQEASSEAPAPDGSRADYQLSMSCMQTKSGLALQLTLLEGASQHVVWSETVDIAIETWFDALRLVIRQVAARLHIYLSSDRLSRIVDSDDTALKNYDAWLRGEHLLSLWTPNAEDEAAGIFRRIVDDDPKFAPALASLASIFNVRHLIKPGVAPDAQQDRQALQLARQAAELDPLDARNHLVVAWSSAMSGEFDKAAIHYELAVSLNPVAPKLLISAAQGLAFLGVTGRARQIMEEALQAAPFLLPYQWCYVCSTCWMIGKYEPALVAATRGGLTTIDTHGWRAAALSMLGRASEAREAFRLQVQAIEPLWAGTEKVTPEIVLTWFTSAFPIARDADRQRLNQCLQACLASPADTDH